MTIASCNDAGDGVRTSETGAILDQLRRLLPPRGVVHVGAGASKMLDDYRRWELDRVLLIEADTTLAQRLRHKAANSAGWQVMQALVAERTGPTRYFTASNPRASGLLEPEALRSVWRNLRCVDQRAMQAMQLDRFLDPADRPSFNWLVIDALPAAAILRGADDLLASCDVVIARSLLVDRDTVPADAAYATLVESMTQLGFIEIAIDEERMPLAGRVLFVRDMRRATDSARGEARRANEELERLRERLADATERSERQRADADGEIAALRQSITQLEGEGDSLRKELREAGEKLNALEPWRALAEAAQRSQAEHVVGLQTQLSAANGRIDLLLQELTDASGRQTRLQSVVERQLLRVEDLETRLRESEQRTREVEQLRMRLGEHQPRLKQMQDQLDALAAERQALVAERDSLREANTIGAEQVRLAEQARAASEERASSLEAQLQHHGERLAERDQALQSTRSALGERESELATARQAIAASEEATGRFELQLARADAQLALLRELVQRS